MRKLIVKDAEQKAVRVLTGEQATEKYAGSEFLRYMNLLGIPEGNGLNVYIHIDDSVSRESFRIHVKDSDNLEIAGGDARGILYGVYQFLEKYAGVRYFTANLEILGEGDITINEDFAFSPVFEFRRSDWKCCRDEDWAIKNGVNSVKDDIGDLQIPEEKGGHAAYVDGMFVHTMSKIFDIPQDQQPCLTDPENVKKAIKKVRQILKSNPKATIISISQNDNNKNCTCERCAAIDKEEGSPAGNLLRFVNEIAADIAEDYPDVTVDTLAYMYTRKTPAITKPLPNVCVRLCSFECCFNHPLDDLSCPQNRAFYKDVEDWFKICDRIYIWDYVTNFSYYIPTFPNFAVLRRNMRFFADHGVKGMYPEGNHNSTHSAEFGELRGYLLAKLMWNPFMGEDEYYQYMDEFLEAYYGEGWRYIRAYIDYTCMEAAGSHGGIYSHPFHYIKRDKWLAMEETIENWWNMAEQMAGDRLEYVKRSRLQWQYTRLFLHPNKEEGKKLAEATKKYEIRWNEWNPGEPDPEKLHLEPWQWINN